MPHLSKDALGWISIAFAIISYIPYIRGILKGKFKPHVFSWLAWTVIVAVVFVAQCVKGGGAGSWAMGFTALMCFVFAVLGYTHGEKNITRGDWVVFTLALLSVPLWIVTEDPVWSVLLLTAIDMLAFWPTIRKSWHRPFEESAFSPALNGVKFGISLYALESFTMTTAFFPAMLTAANFLFVALLLWRRRLSS